MITNRHRLLLLASLVLAPALSEERASADPVRLTSGEVVYARQDAASLNTSHIVASFGTGSDTWDPPYFCGPCASGSSIDLSLSEDVQTNPENGVWLNGSFGSSTPQSPLTRLAFTVTANPTFVPESSSGQAITRFLIQGIAQGNPSAGSISFWGGGTAVAMFDSSGWMSTSYRFDTLDAVPTPEPGSLLLFGSGAALMAARRRARRGKPV